MKKILLLTCVLSLLTTTGCLIAEGGGHGHGRHGSRSTVIVPAAVVVVPVVPVVRVHH